MLTSYIHNTDKIRTIRYAIDIPHILWNQITYFRDHHYAEQRLHKEEHDGWYCVGHNQYLNLSNKMKASINKDKHQYAVLGLRRTHPNQKDHHRCEYELSGCRSISAQSRWRRGQ